MQLQEEVLRCSADHNDSCNDTAAAAARRSSLCSLLYYILHVDDASLALASLPFVVYTYTAILYIIYAALGHRRR